MLKNQIIEFRNGKDLRPERTEDFLDFLRSTKDIDGIRDTLEAWNDKGVTGEELFSLASILRQRAVDVETNDKNTVDVVGTGGSKSKLFNISTAAAFVAAGAGSRVAKHGNRAATSKTGSADALTRLGVNVEADPTRAGEILDRIGICFMFAPIFHSLSAEIAIARKQLGEPTVFNMVGPLSNPAMAPYQLIGVWGPEIMQSMAEAASKLGNKKTWIVHGKDGLDEISLSTETIVFEATLNGIQEITVSPEDFTIQRRSVENLRNFDAEKSVVFIDSVLDGKEGTAMDIVILNAAATIQIGDDSLNFADSKVKAEESIKNGIAKTKLNDLRKETNI